MSSELAINAKSLGKCYRMYDRPHLRLMQMFVRGRRHLFKEFWALRDIDLSVRKGEVFGVIGANGSGKSTLLQILAGTLPCSSGSLEINGRVAALLELGAGFNPEMTGRENVYLNGATFGIPHDVTALRFEEIEEFAGIGDFIDQPVKLYSTGMYVRLAFAASLGIEPDVLIVDEALSVGDVAFQAKCLDRVERLIANGTSILVASHDLQLIRNYCNRAMLLSNGRVLASGNAELVTEQYLMEARKSRGASSGAVEWRKSGNGQTVSWGNGDGAIDAVRLAGEAASGHVASGMEIELVVEASVLNSRIRPRLVFILRDQKGYNLFGLEALDFAPPAAESEQWSIQAVFKFPARLAPGHYTVTARLEDYRTDQLNTVIDKQVGVCAFQVLKNPTGERFLGAMNLGGEVRAETLGI